MAEDFETLLINLTGKPRRETLHGRSFLVAPARMIVPGVLNGSRGPLLYPLEEMQKNPDDWNGIPIVLRHPIENGKHVSARKPSVLNQWGMGWVFSSKVGDSLDAEAWFDEKQVENVDKTLPDEKKVLPKLLAGHPIELSTGLFTKNDPTPGTFNGRPYDAVARDYKPDHLAVLVDEVGACSLKDGCGIGVNAEGETLLKRFINWLKGSKQETGTENKTPEVTGNTMNREEKINLLVTNCACQKADLESLSDNALEALTKKFEAVLAVANAAEKGFTYQDRKFVFNAEKGKFLTTNQPKNDMAEECMEGEMNAADCKKKTMNAQKELTEEEWLRMAPPTVRERDRVSQRLLSNAKQQIVDRLTANLSGEARNKKAASLLQKPLEELEDILSLMPVSNRREEEEPSVNWLGAAGGPARMTFNEDEDADMAPPVINYASKN